MSDNDDATPEWPPASGLSTPTVHASDAIFHIASSILVDAPAALVFELVRDTSSYASWCSWVPRVTIHSQPASDAAAGDSARLVAGTLFTFHVVMDASRPQATTDTQLRVSDVSTPERPSGYVDAALLQHDGSFCADLGRVYRIAWKGEGGFVSRGLRTERFHEVIVRGEDSCEVRTWEVMGGILARTVKWMYHKTLQSKFELWCRELKDAAESRYAEEKSRQTT